MFLLSKFLVRGGHHQLIKRGGHLKLSNLLKFITHCKYIDHKYYDILSCLIYHCNLVIICTADGRIQPMIVPSTTTITWFQPFVVVCQLRFIVDIGIKEK